MAWYWLLGFNSRLTTLRQQNYQTTCWRYPSVALLYGSSPLRITQLCVLHIPTLNVIEAYRFLLLFQKFDGNTENNKVFALIMTFVNTTQSGKRYQTSSISPSPPPPFRNSDTNALLILIKTSSFSVLLHQ
jgi:hypothetical protein